MVDVQEAPPSASLRDNFDRLDLKDKVVLIGTGGALILGFLPWYSVSVMSESEGMTIFGTWYGIFFSLACLATVAFLIRPRLREVALGKFGEDSQALSIPILTGAALVLGPVFFLLDTGGALEPTEGLEMSAGRTGWFYLAFLAAAAGTASAWIKWKIWLDDV